MSHILPYLASKVKHHSINITLKHILFSDVDDHGNHVYVFIS